MKRLSSDPKLKRCSTRHISEITAVASEFGNSAKIIVPRSWLRKRVIAFLHSEYVSGANLRSPAVIEEQVKKHE